MLTSEGISVIGSEFGLFHPQGLSHPGAAQRPGLTAGLGDKVAFFPLAAPPPLNANQSLPALAQWGQSTAGEEGLAWLASRRERRKETDLGMTLM